MSTTHVWSSFLREFTDTTIHREPQPSGYRHPQYAAALGGAGAVIPLKGAGSALMRSPIAETTLADAAAPYPLLCCTDWARLADDLAQLDKTVVSVTAVTDPFGGASQASLERAFNHVVRRFKNHYIVDLTQPRVSAHHRRNLRKARVTVTHVSAPLAYRAEWTALYGDLVRRHSINGTAAFSAESLADQLRTPGVVAFVAHADNVVVAMHLWMRDGNCAYYHLGASSDTGYERRAAFALLAAAIEEFPDLGVDWLDLGGHAGIESPSADGLARFKAGWSSFELPVWLCGRVNDPEAYEALARQRPNTTYFPAYRAPQQGAAA